MDSKIPTKGKTDQSGSAEPRYVELSAARHVEVTVSNSNDVTLKISFISFIKYLLIFKFVKKIIFQG